MEEVQPPLPVGTVIHEHYIVESLLGTGDFGNVYLVRDQRNEQKRFALAELLNPVADESYRFALNYVSRAPLDRRVLPRVQYVYHDNRPGRVYLLMNYIEEPNLEVLRLQQAERRFPLSQVLSIMAPVVNAVIHLHQHHPPLIHGNLNPACILMSQSIDAPVLVMLDLFKEHDSITTPLHYFAPGYGASEQYEGKYSVRTDIYGLCATYYTLLTGVIPPDALYRITQQKNGEVDPLQPAHEVTPAVPIPIAEVIQQAMSLNADARFSSVEQFQGKIASLVEQSSAEAAADTSSTPPLLLVPASPEPEEPPRSLSEEPDNLRSLASGQAAEEPTPVPVPEKRGATRVRRTSVLLIVLAFLLILGVGADFWFHVQSLPATHTTAPVPSVMLTSLAPKSTATPVLSPYPTLARMYRGTIYDVSINESTIMSLTVMQQNQNDIGGYLTLGPKLQGSGPFKGTIDGTKRIQFIVMDTAGNPRLFFEGAMQSSTVWSGDYYNCSPSGPLPENRCTRAPSSYGLWNVILV